jgi:L-ascorbate metabolism protein UlaG (beta-lactamase superfamily)
MDDRLLYLRQNVQVEPLCSQWYAWPHLIQPATEARNITERHLKIIDSYLNTPLVHANAVKNPKMLGGPFIDYGGGRLDEIRVLREKTIRERSRAIELSRALKELDALLRTSATGYSLHPLYLRVPEALRGCVELYYSLDNQPSFRFIEPLLYRSDYYDTSSQALMLSTIAGDDRPFVLSTPRLPGPGLLLLDWSFADPRVDDLFRLKSAPQSLAWIADRFNIPAGDQSLFRSFLTEDPPPSYQPYSGPGVRWRYFGHACILIETQSVTILVDPVLSYTYESGISRFTYADLPDSIDYALITHNHQDHVLMETLLQIRHKVKHIIVPRGGSGALQDPSLRLILENIGFRNVIELGELERIEFDNGSCTGLPFLGEHSDLAISTKLAYLVRLGNESLLFAADSCNIEPMLYHRLKREIGNVSVLFLGMECDGAPLTWLYGPLLFHKLERGMDESRRLSGSNCEQAAGIIEHLGCREVYVYAMGQEPWLNYIMSIKYTEQSRPIVESNRLIAECRARGITAERLFGEKEILLENCFAL